jgi:hypothetical protein
MTKPEITTTIKQTISVKQRTEVGDEVFISVGQEYHNVPVAEADAMKATLDESLSAWLETRVSSVAGAAFESYSDPEKGVAESEDDEEEGAEAADDEEADDELTIEDVQAMKVGELRELIEAHELDVDPKLKVKELREAVIAALFEEEDEEEADEEEEDEEAEEEDEESEEGDEEEEDEDEEEESEEGDEPYTEDELKALKLAELQEIAEAWELKVKHKKGADLKAKKADFVKAILEAQEG